MFGQRGFGDRTGRATGDLDDQPRRDLDRLPWQFRIDAAFEAMGGIGMQAEFAAPVRSARLRGTRCASCR
jgi:hypothetical protein